MQNDRKFFLWFMQTEDGILPFEKVSIKGFNNIFADVGEEEARRLKRKWRKLCRLVLRERISEYDDEDYKHHLSYYGIGEENQNDVSSRPRMYAIRRREGILSAYHDLIKRTYYKKSKSDYKVKKEKKKKKRRKK